MPNPTTLAEQEEPEDRPGSTQTDTLDPGILDIVEALERIEETLARRLYQIIEAIESRPRVSNWGPR